MKSPQVSVIIPCYNEEVHIEFCLKSLLSQKGVSYEILVVDDGSTDNTISIVEKYPLITVLTQNHHGPGAARNKGAQRAIGNILVFVDADMTFDTSFLAKLIQPILSKKAVGTFSKEEYVANLDNNWAVGWSSIRGFEAGRMHPTSYPDTQPVFRAILRSQFEKVGGFDVDRGYDDDWSLSEKLGLMADIAPGAKFYHYNPASLEEVFFQARWLSKRSYKFGKIGMIITIFRSSWPVSLLRGTYKSLRYKNIWLLRVQIIYDLGISVGVLEHFLGRKTAK